MKYYAIAIDGPSGAGKSTIARRLAAELDLVYVDTGALYRAIGYRMLCRGVDPHDAAAVEEGLSSLEIRFGYCEGIQHVWVDGEDVSDRIRTPEVSMAASAVSAYPPVRRFLLDLQRQIAVENNVIMDGRDIGTVVLPDAAVKIFLSASVEERASRRHAELIEKGQTVTYEAVLTDMRERDYNDSHRDAAPLRPAEDAIMVDTTGNTFEQSVALLKSIVEAHTQWE